MAFAPAAQFERLCLPILGASQRLFRALAVVHADRLHSACLIFCAASVRLLGLGLSGNGGSLHWTNAVLRRQAWPDAGNQRTLNRITSLENNHESRILVRVLYVQVKVSHFWRQISKKNYSTYWVAVGH